MSKESIYLIISDVQAGAALKNKVLRPAGYLVKLFDQGKLAQDMIMLKAPDLVIVADGLELVAQLLKALPNLSIIFLPGKHSAMLEISALRSGAMDYLESPEPDYVLQVVRSCMERRRHLQEWLRLEFKRNTKSLQKKVDGLEALQRVGRSVTALLDLDSVLKAVVDAAVELTGAQEGSLLLVDSQSGELYMRAGRNFQEEFVRTFRIPIRNTLPGQVLRSGVPLLLDETIPQKIKTAYLVQSLIYVPLQVQGRMIGVLGVDNRENQPVFPNGDRAQEAGNHPDTR